jgi:CDP-diacylglycerol---glycerol-3-phosphate 3-phosphatidyltransferase
MASIYDLKPGFQRLLRPMVNWLARAGVSANQVTLAAVALSVLQGAWMAWRPWTAAPLLTLPVVLFMRMALNAVDGMLAREHGQQTRLGALLNELGDVVSDVALYLPLAWVPGLNVPLIELIVVLAVMSEMAGVLGQTIGASRRYDGPMGKSDRAFWLGALALALGLGLTPGRWLDGVLLLMIVMLAATIVNRGRRALAETA